MGFVCLLSGGEIFGGFDSRDAWGFRYRVFSINYHEPWSSLFLTETASCFTIKEYAWLRTVIRSVHRRTHFSNRLSILNFAKTIITVMLIDTVFSGTSISILVITKAQDTIYWLRYGNEAMQ